MGKFATAHPEKSLTYSEAYALAQKGAKITHRFMAANEWMDRIAERAHLF